METYEAQGICSNCLYQGPIEAPLNVHLSKMPCPLCQYKGIVPPFSPVGIRALTALTLLEERTS